MKELFKNHKGLILFGLIAIVILYLTQDYYKKTESYKESIKNELEVSHKEKEELKESIRVLKIDISKLEKENKDISKKTKIVITTNKDGSSSKTIDIDYTDKTQKNTDTNVKIEDNEQSKLSIKDLEYKLKESQNSYKEYKLEEEKRSNNTLLWGLGIGGATLLACSITKKCGIIKIPLGR